MIILRQKHYSRKDYLGLDKHEAVLLKSKRDSIAKSLKKLKKSNNSLLESKNSDVFRDFRYIPKDHPEVVKRIKENIEERNNWHDIDLKTAKDRAKTAKELILLKR